MTHATPASSWRPRFDLFIALQAVAVAIWLIPASVHIVSWPVSGPVRLALLSPTWQLLVWCAAAVFVQGVAIVMGKGVVASHALRPLTILWVLVVPYLPWIPDRVPLLLVLAGPLRWVMIGLAIALAIRAWHGSWGLSALAHLGRRGVFAVSLAVYLGFGFWSLTSVGIGGDEPHYLIITESLLRDGDLRIENNHQRGDYRAFFRGDLRPDFMERGQDGQIYSIHAPGLPVLLLPVYALAGYQGAVAFLCVLSAFAALAVFDLASLVARREVALLTWLAVCFTVPFVPHSWAIFPEMPGALIVAWATVWLFQTERGTGPSTRRWLVRGAALACLPWLHTKFTVFLALFTMGFLWRLRRAPRELFALVAPISLSTALWLLFFYAIYGRFDPEAPYGAYTSIYVLTTNIPHGLLGLFFDQKFGLLVYSPVYLMAVGGAWFGLRDARTRFPTTVLLVIVAAYVGSTARLYMFWGGSSAPARFFVPLLPCLAALMALAVERSTSVASKALFGLWLAIGLGIATLGIVSPEKLMLFSDPHGHARLLELFQAGSPLALVIPTFTDPDWVSYVGTLGAWLVAAAAAMTLLVTLARATRARAGTLAAAAAATFVMVGAVMTARPGAEARDVTANRGALDVLWRFDGSRFRTFDYQRLSRASADRLRDFMTLRLNVAVPSDAQSPFQLGPLNLPPGVFDVSVWFKGTRPRIGEVIVAGPRAVFGRIDGDLSNPATFEVDLPAAARRVTVRVPDLDIARAMSEVRLVPRAVPPASMRDPRPAVAIESLPGPHAGDLVYTDRDAYPEMGTFWSRGTASTTVMVAPRGAARMNLVLSTGPMTGTVLVTTEGRSERVPMTSDRERVLTVDLPAGARLVPLTIQSDVMFRPAEVNPSSDDMRGLGCQVRIALE